MLVKKASMSLLGIFLLIFVFGINFSMAETPTQKLTNYANSVLFHLASEPVVVKAVKAENSKKKTLSQIKELDQKWVAEEGLADYMKKMMDSPMGQHLISIRDSQKFFKEIFLCDDQGANIAISDKSSDYWQGDEVKWERPFRKDKVFVDRVKFDASTKSFLAHVGVPVKDGNEVIGVIIFGVDMDIFWTTPM